MQIRKNEEISKQTGHFQNTTQNREVKIGGGAYTVSLGNKAGRDQMVAGKREKQAAMHKAKVHWAEGGEKLLVG